MTVLVSAPGAAPASDRAVSLGVEQATRTAGAVSAVAPFSDPGGVAVGRDGVAYVVDTGSAINGQARASVIKVTPDGKTEVLLDGISVGHPAGIALVNDGTALLVSGLNAAQGTDRVFRLDLGSRSVRMLKSQIGDFYESAGLHRARNAEVFAWADSHANGTGTVYVPKPLNKALRLTPARDSRPLQEDFAGRIGQS